MKMYIGKMVKKLRSEMGMNQEELAGRLFMSNKRLSRIETDKAKVDVWQAIKILELAGQSFEDFWLMPLDSSDYDGYLIYRNLRKSLRDNNNAEAESFLEQFKKSPISKEPFAQQTIAWAEIRLNNNLSHEKP
ncbi:MAG: helix-turn-helix domain-containing protein [Defluviitaleaceae bacterium]|nr:helix-turn-helix domain-containing protein [Defluviitaleaceae bacterium]